MSDSYTTPNRERKLPAPLNFKLGLIIQVQKYSIIWENLKGRKNKDFLEDAWRKVRKALNIQEGTSQFPQGYCLEQWKLLMHNYRSHINRGIPMNRVLVENLEFMKPQLKKSANCKTSLNKPMEKGSTPIEEKVQITTPMSQTTSSTGRVHDVGARPSERAVSVAIINYMFDSLPPDAMTQVCNSLIQVMHSLKPSVSSEILEYGRRQPDCLNIDWSGLSIPEEICREVWKRDVHARLQSSWKQTSK